VAGSRYRAGGDGEGNTILIDPFIAGNPSYPKEFVLPEKIDYILLTHGHGDHISDAVPVARKHGSTVVAIYELAAYVAGKGVERTIGMNLGGTVQLDDVAATMVEATHSAGAEDEHGTHYVVWRQVMCSRLQMVRCFTMPEIRQCLEI